MKKKINCQCGGSLLGDRYGRDMGYPKNFYTAPHVPVQAGSNIFDSIGHAFKKTFSNPLRAIAAVGTLGGSEVALRSADAVEDLTGLKASKIVGIVGAPLALATAGESALPTAAVKAGLQLTGRGRPKKRPKKGKATKRSKAKKRKKRK